MKGQPIKNDTVASDPEYVPASRKRKGGPLKDFKSLGVNQKKNRLKSFRDHAAELMEENNLTLNELFGEAGRTISFQNKDFESAAFYSKMAKGEKPTGVPQEMDVAEAVALKTYTYNGRSHWNMIRKCCKKYGFIIPSRYVIEFVCLH